MKNVLYILFLSLILINFLKGEEVKNIYQFKVTDIDGKEVSLADYKGKTILLVNVASKCGFTKHYKNLIELNEKYKGKNFAILGFPANEFGGQEPGTNEEIKNFCSTNYVVTFPMFSKVIVKGKDQAPLFQFLTTADNPDFKGDIEWNFEKFLVGPDGQLKHRYKSNVVPTDDKITKAVDELIVK